MKISQQKSDFLYIGQKLLHWYQLNARDLPWRDSNNPYNIWISEIILQQTRVEQGVHYYTKFITAFPNIESLANADINEVLLYWKGLGYYSRAINIHKAAQQIIHQYNGVFPTSHKEIIKLKGIGKYTAAAISSICFNTKTPAVDGNFYRVLSRLFADDFDISKTQAHQYFSELALLIMPNESFGNFNQSIMDLGASICKPKSPICENCPINEDCLAHNLGTPTAFPIKTKKTKTEKINLDYYFILHQNSFLIKQRDETSIWKKLYDFPEKIPHELEKFITKEKNILHKLTHKHLDITIYTLNIEDYQMFNLFKQNHQLIEINMEEYAQKSFPKPLDNFIFEYSKQKNI